MQKNKKIVDSSPDVSVQGRASRYWSGKPLVLKSSKDITSKIPKCLNDLDQYDIIKYYRLKGFEYGNWVNNNDRVDKLRAAAISLRDLSRVMRSTNLGFDGMVGIAFGARGQSGAKAHFEPDSFMINLTKNNGDNSLAHEYGHAIDYFFGTYIDQNKNYRSLVGGDSSSRKLKDNKGGQIRTLANNIVDNIINDGNELSESYKKLIKSFDLEYWKRRNEIWARFFEQYVAYILNSLKIKNPFLMKNKYSGSMYLTEKDFMRVKPSMDTFITLISKKMNEKSVSGNVKLPSKKKKVASK